MAKFDCNETQDKFANSNNRKRCIVFGTQKASQWRADFGLVITDVRRICFAA